MICKVHSKRFVYKFVCDLKEVLGYSASELIIEQAGGGGQLPGQGGRQSDQPHPGPRLVPRGVARGGAEARGGAQGGPAARVLQVQQGSQHQPGA